MLLPSDPSSGRKATNLLNWGAAPSQVTEKNYPRAVGHMSTFPIRASADKVLNIRSSLSALRAQGIKSASHPLIFRN